MILSSVLPVRDRCLPLLHVHEMCRTSPPAARRSRRQRLPALGCQTPSSRTAGRASRVGALGAGLQHHEANVALGAKHRNPPALFVHKVVGVPESPIAPQVRTRGRVARHVRGKAKTNHPRGALLGRGATLRGILQLCLSARWRTQQTSGRARRSRAASQRRCQSTVGQRSASRRPRPVQVVRDREGVHPRRR